MQKSKGTKSFDAVKLMREIRDSLSIKYINNPAAEDRDLIRIRKKYGISSQTVKSASIAHSC
jgi:hypothetical protein